MFNSYLITIKNVELIFKMWRKFGQNIISYF